MNKQNDERRRYPRSRSGVRAVEDKADPGVLNHVDNISANGVLCHTIKPVPLMTKMAMALELPEPELRRIDCEGVVVRCEADEQGDDNWLVAILFTRISDEDRDAIQVFVDHDLAQTTPDD